MALNKQSGNMYGFVTHTWNAIKGKCSHNCSYCYMKRFPQNPIRLDEKEFKTDLGKGNFIFVGSSTDMFADDVPKEWIKQVLDHCKHYMNTYLFQTKNPKRFKEFKDHFPLHCIFGITLETNRENDLENCPPRSSRVGWMEEKWLDRKMVTIEPIMDFDVEYLSDWIERINPEFVNIGADSNRKKDYSIPEPTEFKIQNLIKKLELFTKINLKPNLARLYSSGCLKTKSLRDFPDGEHNMGDKVSATPTPKSPTATSHHPNIKSNFVRGLTKMKYGILKIDPPWEKKKGGLRKVRPKQNRELDYPTMEIHSIFNLLDKEIFPLAKENHCVFLWCIDEYLSDIDNWMFERGYKRHARIIWDKENGVAPAFTVRFAHEYLIWYYKGKFMPIAKEWRGKVTTILREKSRQHSRKPNCAYWMIESFYPDENKLDVFAREKRFGWSVWGNETDKFNAPEFTLASPTFPTEKAINRNLQVTPSATPKEATLPSVNSDIKSNFVRGLTR